MPAALATGNSQAFADLAAAISANKFAAIDATVAGESPLLSSLEHWPFTAEGTLRNVAIDQYTLNVDSILDAIAAWDAAHPVVTNPPAITQPPLDLGLPAGCHGRRLWAARALLDHCRPLQRCTGGPNLPPVHISVVLTPHSSWDFADRAGPHPADAGRSPGLGRGDFVPRGG